MKKIYIYLPFILFFIIGCEKEEILDTPDFQNQYSTVSKKEALEHLTTLNSKNKQQNSNLEIYYDQIRQQPIFNSDELITIIPAQIKNTSIESEIYVLYINGKIEHVLFSKISNGAQENYLFSGILSITDLNGKFLKRYRVKDGLFTSQFFLKDKNNKLEDCTGDGWGDGLGCEQELEEVVLIAPEQPANTVPVAGIYDSPDYQDSSLYEDQSGYIGYNSDEKKDIGPSCESFNFTKIHEESTWQEAAVKNVTFKVVVLTPEGLKKTYDISFPQPILFGMPANMINGGDISPGLAAELSAQALQLSMNETVSRYGNTQFPQSIVESYFKERLKYNYPLVTNGGRVNFNPMAYDVIPTEFETNMFGNGNCD